MVCVIPDGYTFFAGMDHMGDDLSNGGLCLTVDTATIAATNFQMYQIKLSGFTLSTVAGGKQRACPKTSAVGTPNKPNSAAPTNARQFAGACQGLYIANPPAPCKQQKFNRKQGG